MLDINLNLYKTFYMVAKMGSITKASAELNVTPPSVSLNISKLEDLFEVKLFDRNNDGVSLTDAGYELLEHVQSALATLEIGEKLIVQKNDLATAKLTIGCPSHLASFYLMDYIVKARKDYPNLQISLISGTSSEGMLELIKNHKIDFIIDTLAIYQAENFTVEQLQEVENIFISKFPIKIENLEELKSLKYILNINDTVTTQKLVETLSKHNISIEPSMESEITEVRIDAAKRDLGVGYVMKQAVKKELERKEIYEVQLPIELPKSQINLIYSKEQLTKAAKQFIKQYLKNN